MIGRVQSGGRIVSAVMRQGLGSHITQVSFVVPTMDTLIDRCIIGKYDNKSPKTLNYPINFRKFSTASLRTDNTTIDDQKTFKSNTNLPSTRMLSVDDMKKIMEELRSIDDNSDER
jgi:hypothetical protein